MTLDAAEATAPASWAAYFVNADATVFEDGETGEAERAAADAFLARLTGGDGRIVGAEDAGYLEWPDSRAIGLWPYAADCRIYTALIHSAASSGKDTG